MCVAFIALVRTTSANAPIKLLVPCDSSPFVARPRARDAFVRRHEGFKGFLDA
jgi:hypothetical protein